MINCQNTTFDPNLSARRLEAASKVFGEKEIKRLFAIVLYWSGVNRQEIADSLGMPVNTIKSFIKTLLSDGIAALVDRRQKEASLLPKLPKTDTSISWTTDDENFVFKIGTEIKIQINLKNKLYLRTIVLTMLNSGVLKTKEAAEIIQLSIARTNKLAKKIQCDDIDSLIDQRKGLTQDYVMTPEIKSQLIEQYVLACVRRQKTSGKALKEQLKQELQLELSDRTIRYHVAKLGLAVIKKTLPKIIDDSKKNSKPT
jgi:transposase